MENTELKMLDMLLHLQGVEPQVLKTEYHHLSDEDPIKPTMKAWLAYKGVDDV